MKWVLVLTVILSVGIMGQHSAFQGLPERYDQFNQVRTYSPYLTADLYRPLMYLSIIEGQQTLLAINFQYVGSSWIWFKRAQVLVNGEVLDVNLETSTKKVLNRGDVFEHGFKLTGTDKEVLTVLRKINKNSVVSVKLSGKVPYYFTPTIGDLITIERYMIAYDSYLKSVQANNIPQETASLKDGLIVIGGFTLVMALIIYGIMQKLNNKQVMEEYLARKKREREEE